MYTNMIKRMLVQSSKKQLKEGRGVWVLSSYKMGDCRKDGARLFLVMHNGRARSNRQMVEQGEFWLDTRRKFSPMQMNTETGTKGCEILEVVKKLTGQGCEQTLKLAQFEGGGGLTTWSPEIYSNLNYLDLLYSKKKKRVLAIEIINTQKLIFLLVMTFLYKSVV